MRSVLGSGRARAMYAAVTLLAISLLAGCAATPAAEGSQNLKTIRVALGWIPNVEYAGFWLADNSEYYAKEGLKIQWIPGGPNAPDPESSVASGEADLGLSADSKTLVDATTQGNDFALLGTVYQNGPGCLLSLSKDPVTKVSDLPGKTFLAQDEAVVRALFRVNGLKPTYKFKPTSFDPGPLVEGDGDAYTAYITNQAVAMELKYGLKEGTDFTCTLYSDLNFPTYSSIIFGKKDFLKSNREAVTGFLRASVRGWLENGKNPSKAAELATNKYGVDLGLDLNQQIKQNERQIPLIETGYTAKNGVLRIDEDHLGGAMYAALRASGSKDLRPVKDIVDQTFLDEVYRDGLTPTGKPSDSAAGG